MSDRIPGSSASNPIIYGDWEICVTHSHPHGGFDFAHKDYDGPEDDRCGHAMTVEKAKLEIDEHPSNWTECQECEGTGGNNAECRWCMGTGEIEGDQT